MASSNDFMQMQREAEKRVMEMQRRAKIHTESKEPKAPPIAVPSAPVISKPAKNHSFLDMLNLKTFFENKDTSLVLMVLALLNAEETDPLLMLALLYVIL